MTRSGVIAGLTAIVLAGLLCGCARTVEPGLYRVQTGGGDGFVRVYTDSLGVDRAVLYRNLGNLWADTLGIDLKEQKLTLRTYEPPEFHRFSSRELYREPVYGVSETKDIIYGRVVSNLDEERRVDLQMDLYVPKDEGNVARPLLVVFHGGAFQNGNKSDSTLVEWCRYFASLGYVVSSVDYRQGYHWNVKESDDAMYKALKDANAAVRFILKRDSLLVHSERIFAAGVDAGAITALNLAFMREENMPEIIRENGDSTVVTHQSLLRGFDIRSVANLWGAVPDTAILRNAKIPVISFHSREDPVVPFGAGHPFDDEETDSGNPLDFFRSVFEEILSVIVPELDVHLFRTMYGSGEIDRILKGLGVPSELHAYKGDRHDLFLGEDGTVDYQVYDEIKEQTASFFASRMVVAPVSLRQDPEDPQMFVIDNTEVGTCLWNVEGGVLVGKGDDAVRVLFFPDMPEHAVSVSGVYASGLTFYEQVVVEGE